jgi:DNA-binding Lrp family transcriptional regulator
MRGDKRERILRVLLSEKDKMSKNELAKRAECTRPWVIKYLRQLEGKGFVKGTEVIYKKGLIEYWISIHKKPKKIIKFMVKNPLKLLEKTKLDYALTTYHAENVIHHYLFLSRVDIYIKEENLQEWHDLLTRDGLIGGGNMTVRITDPHVLYGKQKLKKLWLVSTAQLIIDLWLENGPCREAAEMMLKNVSRY